VKRVAWAVKKAYPMLEVFLEIYFAWIELVMEAAFAIAILPLSLTCEVENPSYSPLQYVQPCA
jgi:hypothetical protein